MESVLDRMSYKRGLYATLSGFVVINAIYLSTAYDALLNLIVAIVGIILTTAVAYRLAQASLMPWLRTLGNLSMPIYLLHVIAGAGTRFTLQEFLGNDNVYINLMLCCAAGIIMPVLFYKVATRIRISTLLFGR